MKTIIIIFIAIAVFLIVSAVIFAILSYEINAEKEKLED